MPRQRTPLHEAARAWAQAGFFVFPCIPNGKRPATEHGLDDATTDLNTIDRWWFQADYNIGVSPSRTGMFVVDQDGPLGAETLASLCAEHGALPNTLTVRTPRGPAHLHHWFVGDCASTVQRLGPKLDTRGQGGYVLVPPSIVDGTEYTYDSEENEIAIGPEWIGRQLSEARQSSAAATEVELDQPSALGRVAELLSSYAARGHVAIEGAGGDAFTYAIAAEVLNLGLSPEAAFDAMQGWNAACDPPWDADDLRTKIANAAAYAQNDQGAWAVPPAEEVFAAVAAKYAENRITDGDTEKRISRFYPHNETEQDARPEPTWLLPAMIPDKSTIMMFGPSGAYKTFLALDICLTLASGRAAYGCEARDPMASVYIAAEGARGIERFRRPAWRQAHKITAPLPFYTIDAMPLIARPNDVLELIEAIKKRGIDPKLVVIDTLARALAGKNENDARDAGELIEGIEAIKRALGCSVLVLHHTGKDDGRGARGSSSLGAGFDSVLEVKAHDASKAVSLRVDKHKDAERPMTPWTFEGHKVASSLVFFETDTVTHHKLTKGDDAFSPIKIGAVLRSLHAIGQVAGVSTHALALSLVPPLQGDSVETAHHAITRAERQLRDLSKTYLRAYTDANGKAMRWFLPETDIAL